MMILVKEILFQKLATDISLTLKNRLQLKILTNNGRRLISATSKLETD